MIFINAPAVERRLAQEAQRHGVEPADYAVQILTKHLGAENGASDQSPLPFYATATPEEWNREFSGWLEGHAQRNPLPADAFDRESFYEGRP
ncbi:hypothetical protein CCAX7_61620 [Capsulimonas corticalis]|uniref:Uncharacterized protein n=1 Tax=Capsulimonas corticalis TaxID=2219043 RepID=A0A402CWC9_9BACT|nr:hypothetical protein [Capsulimonas corticalis]BDI34111.1 hypothetical protein CCAX7_61620 [Capsulimonas corticalis]